MAEGITEIEKSIGITPEEVIKSISENESWWEKFQEIMKQGYPVNNFLADAISVLNKMEETAQHPHLPQTKEEAEKIRALWVIAAAGAYSDAKKKDRYEDKEWALWNDRQRVNYAFKIGRRLAEIKLGHPISDNWTDGEKELTEYAPLIVYNGTPVEDAAVLEAIKTPWLRIPEGLVYPKNKVLVINPLPPIDNTLDQVRTFRLPLSFKISPGDEIGVVIHAPQTARFLYALAKFEEVVPKGAKIRILPLPTPPGGYPEYPLQELRGMVSNRFISNPAKIADSPYPFKV